MPRQGRIHVTGGLYHVIFRGIEKRRIFVDANDRGEFIRRLAINLKKTSINCFAWALLPNHVHLLLSPLKTPMCNLMRRVLTGYAVYFNHRHKRVGHLFQNRYRSILCQKETYFLELIRYIHLNPLRANIIKSFKELDKYPWSGHRVLLGNSKNDWQSRDEVLHHFGETQKEATWSYQAFIQDKIASVTHRQFEEGDFRRNREGWNRVQDCKAREFWKSDERLLGEEDFIKQALQAAEEEEYELYQLKKSGLNLENIAEKVCRVMAVEKADIKKKWRVSRTKYARALVAYWGKRMGITGIEISKYLGVSNAAVGYLADRGERYARERSVNLLF